MPVTLCSGAMGWTGGALMVASHLFLDRSAAPGEADVVGPAPAPQIMLPPPTPPASARAAFSHPGARRQLGQEAAQFREEGGQNGVVVPRALHADEAPGAAGRGKQAGALGEGHRTVVRAVEDKERPRTAAGPGQAV